MAEVITSPSNPKIKRLLALQQKSSARREAGLFIVEGQRELQHCIDAGFEIDTLFVCPSLSGGSPRQNFASLIPPTASQRVPPVHEATGGHGFAGESPASASGQAATALGNRATLGIVRGRGPSSDGRGPAEPDVSRGELPACSRV